MPQSESSIKTETDLHKEVRTDVRKYTSKDNGDAGGRLEHKVSSAPKAGVNRANGLPRAHIGKHARTEDTVEDTEPSLIKPKRLRHGNHAEAGDVVPLNLQPAAPQSAAADKDTVQSNSQRDSNIRHTSNVKDAPKVPDAFRVENNRIDQEILTKDASNKKTPVITRKRTRTQSWGDNDESSHPNAKRTRIESSMTTGSLPKNQSVSSPIHPVLSVEIQALRH